MSPHRTARPNSWPLSWWAIGIAIVVLGMGLLRMTSHRGMSTAAAPDGSAAVKRAPTPIVSQEAEQAEGGYIGVIMARESVDVAARLDGRLDRVNVRLGDVVQREQVLATMDTQVLRSELAMAAASLSATQATVDGAQAELAQARERLARILPLIEGKTAISGDESERARYQKQIAAAKLEGARAMLRESHAHVEQMQTLLSQAEIHAPFAGSVTVRYADPGATVTKGTPIVRVISADDLLVRLAVPEADDGKVSVGLPLRIDAGVGSAMLRGMVEKVAPEVDVGSRMIFVEARIDAKTQREGQMLAGRVVRVFLPGGGTVSRSARVPPRTPHESARSPVAPAEIPPLRLRYQPPRSPAASAPIPPLRMNP